MTHIRLADRRHGRRGRVRWRSALAVFALGAAVTCGAAPTASGTTSATSPTAGTGVLDAVGVFANAGYDQVVFQFVGGAPPYTVAVVHPPLLADASGQVITMAGTAFVKVVMHPASGFDPETGTPVYTGPKRITFNGASVVEVVQGGDFEGYLTWYISLTEPVPMVSTTASDPGRIAIDFQHPAAAPANPPTFTG